MNSTDRRGMLMMNLSAPEPSSTADEFPFDTTVNTEPQDHQ